MKIDFQLPDAVCPRSIRTGQDARTLAIAMLTVRLKVSKKAIEGVE
ncbi:hypothetical protein MYX78_03290 [Acidobacteria bacterium AH-259-G07]|nr:hypothetical protein [Acidobacteria bacterium AH-259-G07]